MIPLLILGLIKQNPGSYGYELLSLMEERHYKYIVNFTKGSFYYNLQKLEEKKYIKRVDRLDNVRETQNYIITELGNKEFEKLMFKYGSKTEYINLPFYGAMLLEESIKNDNSVQMYFKKMMENSLSHHLVNLKWFEELIKIL